MQAILYTFISVIIVSLISFTGALALFLKKDILNKVLIFFVSFSAGALLGTAFFHLLPEVVEDLGDFHLIISIYILSGILFFFVLEKLILWKHCHFRGQEGHEVCVPTVEPYAINNLVGDGAHNFIDGAIIAGSFLVSPFLGLTTSLAVVLHEIPQELSDFGVLIHGGFTPKKALFFNFISALVALLGAGVALYLGAIIEGLSIFLVSFTIGSFIYIASSDLIPQLHKEFKPLKSFLEFSFFLIGILVMFALLAFE